MSTTQEGRLLSLATPLAADFLLIKRIRAAEGISQLFRFELEMLHEEDEVGNEPTLVDPQQLLGQKMTVSVTQADGAERFFNGICVDFTQGNRNERFSKYKAELVPEIWLLSQNSQSRIFQNQSVPEILRRVFDGFEYDDEIQGTFEPRNYCVQYRESDFNFASRLMEEEGIYYYFEHTADSHRMIIANTPGSHRPCPTKAEIPFAEDVSADQEEWSGHVTSWRVANKIRAGKFTLRDYNFQLPTNSLEAVQMSRFNIGGNQDIEIYDHPGEYAKRFDGIAAGGGEQPSVLQKVFDDRTRTVGIRQEEIDVAYKSSPGSSDSCAMTAGYRFQLTTHPIAANNRNHVLVIVRTEAVQSPGYISDDAVMNPYSVSFTSIPQGEGQAPFRPLRRTEKPIVYGSQTATVTGPSGEEIFVDKFGRVKVHFHWDRLGQTDATSSCWLRVATNIAGNKWGTMFIPRVGQEVIVDFLGGDPDQPIIIGSAYNPETMPHYDLPKFKTLTYIKTRTSPDDGKGFNELRFEDKASKEQVFIRSQKRYDLRARGSMYETCGGNRQEVIGMRSDNQPGGNLAISVGGNYDLHVKADHYIGIDGKRNETVTGDVINDYQAIFHTQAGTKAELTAPQITLEANTKITFKCGSSFLTLDPSGVTISGPMIKINSGGVATGPSFPSIDSPLDAEAADTGEPGYLDRPRTGGGGGGRRRRTLTGNRLPNVRQNPDGSFQVGNSIRVEGTPEFCNKALTNLSTLSSTRTGNSVITALDNGTHQTTIRELDMARAQQNGALATRVDRAGSTTPGTGSDTIIEYNPDLVDNSYVDENGVNHTVPIESTLGHEMIHAVHNDQGTNLRDNAEPAEAGSNEEESQTIGIHGHADDPMTENNILEDMNQPIRRDDHDSTVHTVP